MSKIVALCRVIFTARKWNAQCHNSWLMWISPTEMEIPLLQIISHHNKQVTFLLLLTIAVMILRNAFQCHHCHPYQESVISDHDVCIIVIITPVTSLFFHYYRISTTLQYLESKYLVTRPQMGRVTKSILQYKEFISLSKHDNISIRPDWDLARYFIDTFFVTLCLK